MRRRLHFLSQRYTNAQIDAKLAELKNELSKKEESTVGNHGPIVDIVTIRSYLNGGNNIVLIFADGTHKVIAIHERH